MNVSRRGSFKFWSGWCASLVVASPAAYASITATSASSFNNLASEAYLIRARLLLREAAYEAVWEKLPKESFAQYFGSLDLEHFVGSERQPTGR